jgi:DNA repair protein RadC
VTDFTTMTDDDLAAAVLGPRRGYVLAQVGGLRGIARAGYGSLAESTSDSVATKLLAAVELGRRALIVAALDPTVRLPDRTAVERWASARLSTLDHEELWVLCLDGRHGMRAAVMVASGGIHGLHVTVRDVLRAAVKEAASAFVLVHNHPSGDPTPSEEDNAFTRAVVESATVLGTPMLDHVIVARRRSSSYLDGGMLAAPRKVRMRGEVKS